ncbi:MAG: penicillin-binding protein 2 [Solirubrobacteraceae bacterium]|nr:penicillin-binding protein 2 [Solirubrobacteraceae bacterium]
MTQERRLRIFGLVVLLVFGVAWGRAAWLTTVEAKPLTAKLDEGRQPVTLAAPRGQITDRNGIVMAISEAAADVTANPLQIEDIAATAAKLATILDLPEADLYKKLADGRAKDRGFVYVARQVSEEQGKAVRELATAGIDTWPTTRRQYPQGTVASQLVGSAGVDGDGLSGVEQSLEKTLHGKDGKRLLVRGRGGEKVVYIKDEQPVEPGKSVKLTIDARIQAKAEEELATAGTRFGAKSATAIVMQPSTGKVLAMANWPKVDANDAAGAPSSARIVQGTNFTYEPGSTFKPFTVAGALEEKEITPLTSFTLPPVLMVADRPIKESHDRGTIVADTGQILAQSSNIGTVMIAQRLGKTRFDQWIRKFGFGRRTGVELAREERGKLIDVGDYSGSSIGNLPIGQGELVTPIQLATGYSTFANDGIRHEPTLVDEVNGVAHKRPAGDRVVSARTASEMRAMLEKTSEVGGTATGAAIKGYDIATKTGTAQKVAPGSDKYTPGLYTGSIVGMAPSDRPKIVVAIIVDEPSKEAYYGAEVAGPAFKNLTRWTLNYLGVAPN